jgi:methylmalonyl-CoA epimerase
MKIHHIGIATDEIGGAAKLWRDLLGLEADHTEEVPTQKVRVCMLPVAGSRLELLEPMSEDSPISRFLNKRGAGIHHVALSVEDIRKSLADLKSKGTKLIDEEPRMGAGGCLVAFIHPSSTGGVLLELVQEPHS